MNQRAFAGVARWVKAQFPKHYDVYCAPNEHNIIVSCRFTLAIPRPKGEQEAIRALCDSLDETKKKLVDLYRHEADVLEKKPEKIAE